MNASLWERLLDAGLVDGAEPQLEAPRPPWYVSLLLALSGWVAALFLFGFFGFAALTLLQTPMLSLIVGAGIIGAAMAIFRGNGNDFVQHLGLCASLTGQGLLIWGVFSLTEPNFSATWVFVLMLSVGLAVSMPHALHRTFSAFSAGCALAMTLTHFGAPYIHNAIILAAAAWCWLNEYRFPRWIGAMSAIGYGLVLALVALIVIGLYGYDREVARLVGTDFAPWAAPWHGELLMGLTTLSVVAVLMRRAGRSVLEPIGIAALAGAVVFVIVSLEVPGITAGFVVMVLGFASQNRVLVGLGLACLLFFCGNYYYFLAETLLYKAGVLLCVSAVLLLGCWVHRRFVRPAYVLESS
ncbi:MAG: DUF4401 domain-containing protein [Gammaproteobacteria bacterium]|nr:DUF4401 domain-containing protein [Gammaproteobacteria bacterium]